MFDNEMCSASLIDSNQILNSGSKNVLNNPTKLKIIHLNIQYLRAKIDIFTVFLKTESPDIVIISEHGLRKEELYAINFENYELVTSFSRTDHKCSGGIALIIKSNLIDCVKILNLEKYSKEMILEAGGIELVFNKNERLFLVGVYRPPSYTNVNNFFNTFYTLLSKYMLNKNRYFLLVGDLNIDWLKDNLETKRLKYLLNEFNVIQYVNSPTRVTSSSSTLIDHVLSNVDRDMLQVEVVGTGLSDHYAQHITYTFKHPIVQKLPSPRTDEYSTIHDTRASNLNTLNYLLSRENWKSIRGDLDAEGKLQALLKLFNYHFSVACPIKKKMIYKTVNRKPWLTNGIIRSSNKLKELDFKRKILKSSEFLEYYKSYRKIYYKVINAAKSSYICEQLANTDNVARDAWRIIDKDRKKKQVPLAVESPSVEEFNQYFSNIGKHKSSLITEPPVQSVPRITCPSTLSLSPTDPREVYKIIMNLKNSYSAGYDGLTHKVIRHCARFICEPLSEVINSSLKEGLFPQELKQSIIKPIFKEGNSKQPENWRPIANISTISKVFEHVFVHRLLDFLFKNNLICKQQFGFVKGRSTTDAMVDFVSNAITALDEKEKTVGVFLDLQKAFDCLDHKTLFERMYDLGVRGVSLDWIKSYLSKRCQKVQVKSKQSSNVAVQYGIPQGSVLGPVLFILYINNITTALPNLQMTIYADDISLIFKRKLLSDLEVECYCQLSNLFQYLNSNNLHVNPSKTKCLYIKSNRNLENQPSIFMNDFELQLEDHCKYLGVIFDKHFSWSLHIDTLCSKLSSQLFLLGRLATYQNVFLMRSVYFSLIESRLRYGIILWGSTSNTNFLRLFRLQKRAIRIMAGVNRRTSCKTLFKSLNILTLASIYILEILTFYKYKLPAAETGSNIHSYNTRHNQRHRPTTHRLEIAAHLPKNIGAKLFNSLPEPLKLETNPKNFQYLLKTLLLGRACYTVNEFLET